MKTIFTILSFIILNSSLHANTTYLFKPSDKNPLTGKCYEIDEKTNGDKFWPVVKTQFCKPNETIFLFKFDSGYCYEADKETGGKKYIFKVKKQNCKTKDSVVSFYKINNKAACYEFDLPSKGKFYYRLLKMNECDSPTKNYKFFWKKITDTRGECYKEVDTINGSTRVKADINDCRPGEVGHKFIKGKTFFTGNCYEIHKESPDKYIKKVKVESCRPKNTVYIFYQPEGASRGYCYEIDQETKGESYIDKVNNKYCKESLN